MLSLRKTFDLTAVERLKTRSTLPDELMMRSTPAIAVCCWRTSASSRLSLSIAESRPAADELRGGAAFPLWRFSAAALRGRDLTDPVLERPLIVFLELRADMVAVHAYAPEVVGHRLIEATTGFSSRHRKGK